MIKSMTGFGQAVGGRVPMRWLVEIRSWNHRFFECATRLPNVLTGLDEKIRDLIQSQIQRGKVSISISLKAKPSLSNGPVLDETKVRFYVRALRRIQKKYGLAKEPIRLHTLIAIPDLFTVDQEERSVEAYWRSLKPLVERAIQRLVAAKKREGLTLEHDLIKRAKLIEQSLRLIKSDAKRKPAERYGRLKARLAEVVGGVGLNPSRLEQEVALLAERSDITEEVVRADHHLDHFRKSLATKREIGKKLDFIAQELHREVNTMTSKAQSSVVSEHVIRIKSELDKIREQVQNIE